MVGRLLNRFSLLAIVLVLGVSLAWAQQGQPQQQTSSDQQSGQQPNGQGTSSTMAPTSQEQTGEQQPSTEPNQAISPVSSTPSLTGAEQYTLSHMGVGQSYVIPSFQFGQSVLTTGTGPFGKAGVESVSTLSGLLSFHHLWRRYDLSAQYAGTGFLYNQHPGLDSSAHEFTLSQQIKGRRSSFLLTDVVSYLPEASFGYAAFSGSSNYGTAGYGYGGLYGASGNNLNLSLLPNQSILVGPSSRVSNALVGEYDYLRSPLSSFTVSGSYAVLRFPTSGYIDSDDAIFQLGYNHSFTPKDSIGLSYQADIFRFGQSSGNFTNHLFSLIYRRNLSERLALQFGAGPQVNVFSSSAPGQRNQVTWQASGLLNYLFQRSSVGLYYQHYTSGGSGVYLGARTDNVGVSFATPVSRMWSADASLGYAYNTTLQGGNLAGAASSYNSWYGGINIQRIVNRWMSMFFSYNLQQELASGKTCIGITCGTFSTQQYFSFGFSWHPSRLSDEYNVYQQQ
jgi:hypothetical protein